MSSINNESPQEDDGASALQSPREIDEASGDELLKVLGENCTDYSEEFDVEQGLARLRASYGEIFPSLAEQQPPPPDQQTGA